MQTRWTITLFVTLALLVISVVPAAAHPGLPPTAPAGPLNASPSAWGTGAPVPTAAWLMGGASIDNCTFYAIGGNTPGSHAVTNVDLYNPLTDAWTSRAPLPIALYGIQPSAYGARIYVVGGYPDISVPTYAVTSTLIYDSLSNSWSNGAPIPVGVNGIGTAAQAAYNGKIYVIGGDDGDLNSNNTNYEYTIASDSWTLRAPMPTARENDVAVALNGKIYVAGGAQGSDPDYNGMTTFEAYDPATDTWSALAPMQTARVSPGIATDGAYVYVYGGEDSLGAAITSLASAERYNPATNSWSYVDTMAQSTGGMTAAYAAGRIYAAGGINSINGVYTRINTTQYLTVGANGCQPTAVNVANFARPDRRSSMSPLWLLALLALGGALAVTRRLAHGRSR